MAEYICIDIGGTMLKYARFDPEKGFLERQEMLTGAAQGGPAILEKVCGIIESYLLEEKSRLSSADQESRSCGMLQSTAENSLLQDDRGQSSRFCGICISTAGIVNPETGSILHANENIPSYTGTQIKRTVEDRFHIPCEVENDVNCACLAEYWLGAAKGCGSCLCITIGTGIGGAFILNGSVLRGHTNSACELGYLHVPGGTLDRRGSARGMVMSVAERKGENADSWDGRKVFQEAEKGDIICIDAIREMADILGHSIADLCYVLNPEVVVLGGGIMQQETILLPLIRKSMDAYLLPGIAEHTELRAAQYRNNAGMLGAYCHFSARNKEC